MWICSARRRRAHTRSNAWSRQTIKVDLCTVARCVCVFICVRSRPDRQTEANANVSRSFSSLIPIDLFKVLIYYLYHRSTFRVSSVCEFRGRWCIFKLVHTHTHAHVGCETDAFYNSTLSVERRRMREHCARARSRTCTAKSSMIESEDTSKNKARVDPKVKSRDDSSK